MKSFIFFALVLFSVAAFATQGPFQPWEKDLINQKVIDMASAKILVGDSTGKAAPVSMSGDATISNAGVVTIAAGAVDETSMPVPTADGLNAHRIARATYDVAVDGGTVAAHGLGVTLPANAIMVRSWFYTVTQFVDGGAGTVALHCQTANNIFSAADITGNADGTLVDGIQQAFATFDGTGAAGALGTACELTATVAGAEQTAGKLVLFVEYVVAE